MSGDVERLVRRAINTLSDYQGRAGCNDLMIPNTLEMENLHAEYNKWNSGATSPKDPQWMPFPDSPTAEVCTNDGFLIFLLRKHTGTLKRPTP